MLTCIDHLGLYTEEISHTGEQLCSNSTTFTPLFLFGSDFGLGHALG